MTRRASRSRAVRTNVVRTSAVVAVVASLACGGVSAVSGELGDIEIAALREQANGFHLVGYELELTGYCPDCAPSMGNGAGASSN